MVPDARFKPEACPWPSTRGKLWLPAVAGMTKKEIGTKFKLRTASWCEPKQKLLRSPSAVAPAQAGAQGKRSVPAVALFVPGQPGFSLSRE